MNDVQKRRFGAWIFGLFAVAGTASAQMGATAVVVAEAEMRELPSTLILVGTVEPLMRSLISSEIAGIVETMPVRDGDLVTKNALIVKLNDDVLRWSLAEAKAALNSELARLKRWEFEVERISNLYGEDQANEKEVYDARADHDIAKWTVEQRRATVSRLESDLKKTEIRVPFTGDVIRQEAEVGEWIERGGAVVEIIDLSSVLVRINVPEYAIPYTRIGDTARVKIDAVDRVFNGKIRHIIRQADPNARTYPVEIIIENKDGALASGMFARATVVSGSKQSVVAVPKDAIVERDGVQYVGLVLPAEKDGHNGMLIPVTTGADVADWIALTSNNVQPGMSVVVRGNERLFPFPSPIRIVDDTGTPIPMKSNDGAPRESHGK